MTTKQYCIKYLIYFEVDGDFLANIGNMKIFFYVQFQLNLINEIILIFRFPL